MIHFNLPKGGVATVPASTGNQITKEYYDFLVGEINRGSIKKAVCRIDCQIHRNYATYHLISV